MHLHCFCDHFILILFLDCRFFVTCFCTFHSFRIKYFNQSIMLVLYSPKWMDFTVTDDVDGHGRLLLERPTVDKRPSVDVKQVLDRQIPLPLLH